MEDEVLTAVTARQAQIATVAPIPSISNRLSVADFQKLNSETPGSKHFHQSGKRIFWLFQND